MQIIVFNNRTGFVDALIGWAARRPITFRCKRSTMGLPNLREFVHAPCRFRLRSGREVFGVVWEVVTKEGQGLWFATIGEYEQYRRNPHQPISAVPVLPEEILLAERLAG